MTPRASGRTAACGRAQAIVRLEHAEKFHEVAELVAHESETIPASASVSASLAILAGIAAADAACCTALGRRSRSQDHKHAVDLLRQVVPGGPGTAASLDRLLDLKDAAQYGVINVSGQNLRAALRQATIVVEFAKDVLRRSPG